MQYGTQKTVTKAGDDIVSVETTSYFDSKATTIRFFEQRIRVENQNEELAEFTKFNREHPPEQRISFVLDHSKRANKNGYYYVVKSWYVQD